MLFPFLTEAYGFFAERRLQEIWEQEAVAQEEAAVEAEKAQERLVDAELLPEEEEVLSRKISSLPLADAAKEGEPDPFPRTKIIIPKIAVDQVVLDGTEPDILKNGPGHYLGMANPGAEGNLGIAGHRVTFTRPFNRLDELKEGDLIVVETLDYRYEYTVTVSKVVSPKDVSMLRPTTEPVVTLTTCHPKFSARYRLNVRGELSRQISKRPSVLHLVRREIKDILTPRERAEEIPQTAREFELWQAEELVKARPESIEAHLEAGVVYMEHRQLGKAAAEFKRASTLDPGMAAPHYYLALLRQREQTWPEAIDQFEKAIELDPGYEVAYHELGLLLLDRERYDDAVAMFERSVTFSPMAADSHYYLGVAYENLNQSEEASEHYTEALRFDSDYTLAKTALQRLEE